MFRDHNGGLHQVLGKNVHGIFKMPFGIVTFTGLAHLGRDSGDVYLVTALPVDNPVAKLLHHLPGSPEQVVRAVSGNLLFKVNNGHFEKNNIGYKVSAKDCYRMTKNGDIQKIDCSSIVIVN